MLTKDDVDKIRNLHDSRLLLVEDRRQGRMFAILHQELSRPREEIV